MNRWRDPRHGQIAALAALLLYGVARLDLDVRASHAAAAVATALLTQLGFTRCWRLPAFDPRSALITGLSLSLLLRSSSPFLVALAAALAIGSKFLIRWRGKHVFNPATVGITALLAASDRAWVSPGQWGSAAYLAFLAVCLGMLVVRRAERSDVTWAFLVGYAALLVGRSLWLGEPLAIPLHRLQNGAFLIFAFFMISDPKTTPDSRPGRLLFAALVALGAGYVGFHLHRPNGLIWSLACLSPIVPLIDRLLPGARYRWSGAPWWKRRGSRASGPIQLGEPSLERSPR